MRKLTPKEVAALCAALGAFAIGSKHAQACDEISPCTLPPVTINACSDCELLPPGIEFTPISDPGGPAYTPPTVSTGGGNVSPFKPANNPNCVTPGVDTTDIKNFIMQNEGNDAAVEAMSVRNYGLSLTNETGYVPWTNATKICGAGPSCTSGFTTDGVDLSEWFPSQLEAYGAPSSIFTGAITSAFMPYKTEWRPGLYRTVPGATGWTAVHLIEVYTTNGTVPLLTATEAQELNSAAYGATLANLRDNIGSVNFAQLPNNTQQALMDFAWNQDAGYLTSSTAGLTVQSYVENGDWLQLASYLAQNGGLRGGLEAGKIVQDITTGKLPEQGQPC